MSASDTSTLATPSAPVRQSAQDTIPVTKAVLEETVPALANGSRPQRRPHQQRALAKLQAMFPTSNRAQLHWACGTGKTLVGRWLAEDLDAGTVLVLVPSLALVAQTLAEWQTGSDWAFTAIVVCSDRTTGDAWRIDPGWWGQHGVEVTTDAATVTKFLTHRTGLPRVVFSTYHSSAVVATAARRAGAVFDVVVCDEAHRLAGDPDDRFSVVLDESALRARRRLFTTATPIYTQASTGVLSMSDKALFGPIADRLDVAEAIADRLLVDYQVLVLDASGDADKLDAGARVPAALAAAAREGLTRVISFHSRVARARRFATAVDGLRLPDGRTVRARAVAGTDPADVRRDVLADLAAGAPDTVSLVANARCLTEGVNVPAVDGVVFADPKTSDTDIVQAIGRALRPAPGKTRGLIILPVVVPPGADSEELFAGPFAAVWGVLRALRSVDPRMAAELRHAHSWRPAHHHQTGPRPGELLRFDLTGVDVASLAARVLDEPGTDETWAQMLDLLRDWSRQHGHTAVPWGTMVGGRPLGRWAGAQRRAYALDVLHPSRVTRLNAVPGWAWTVEGAWWNADHAAVSAIATKHGGLDLHDTAIAGLCLSHRGRRTLTVGRWCAHQRRAYRTDDLTAWQAAACETILGWSWSAGVPALEQRMVDALAEWVEKHHDANVPHEAKWGAAPLGAFISTVRLRAVTGRLALPLAEELAVVTPAKPSPGSLDWQTGQTRWHLHLLALRQFVTRTGGCDIPEHWIEEVSGYPLHLYAWATRQRHAHRHGTLDPDRATLLEQVQGWAWERTRQARVRMGIGLRQHGTRAGYAAGCLCDDCTAANTAAEAERQRLRAAGEATTDLVDAGPARGHLRLLEGQVGKRARPTMQQITGLNKKTIDDVINGARARIHPEVNQALCGLTVDMLRAHIAANPSPHDPLPAEPTLALVDDLVQRGWPKAWISREIGTGGRALQIGQTGSQVRRESAEAIAALHAAVGNRTPPRRRSRSALPTLAQILAAEHGPVVDR